MTVAPKVTIVTTRWLVRRDMPVIVSIENENFDFPWTENDFVDCLRSRNCIGIVAEVNQTVVGYMIYELHKTHFQLVNISVDKQFRRMGVAKKLVGLLTNKLEFGRRMSIYTMVAENNLGALNFLKSLGFIATSIERKPYDNVELDGYKMEFNL